MKRLLKRICLIMAFCMVVYVLSILIVFDLSSPAYKFDVEYNRLGKEVALGPKPRWFICPASYAGIHYTGEEWPFKAYKPVCSVWISLSRFEPAK